MRMNIRTLVAPILLFSLTTPIFAQNTPQVSGLSLQQMLQNFAAQVPQLTQLATAFAYVLGMWFIISGINKLKQFGESRTMYSQEHGVLGPIVTLAVGALLLYLPTTVQVGMSTFWLHPNPYGYLQQQDQWAQFLNACFVVVQFVGVVAFIRGLVLLSHLGGQGGQQGTFAKGITHIIGGILCINIFQFIQMINATFGIQWQL